jgi:hypothetical protein
MDPKRTLALLTLLLGATRAAGADAGAVPLKAGDQVKFELSALPQAFEGEGKATCTGTRVLATGPTEVPCQQRFRFEVPVEDARMVFTFRAAKGGAERRIELPATRAAKPVAFTAPADGTLLPPAPITLPQDATDRAARQAAVARCGECQGSDFSLTSFEVTRRPVPANGELPVRLAITPAAPAAPK